METAPTIPPDASPITGSARSRLARPPSGRIRRDGKFFRLGDKKFHVCGVTYGPFAESSEGAYLPERYQARRDLAQIREMGGNVIRIYHLPPDWFLDLAHEIGIRVFMDVAWPKNLRFIGDPQITAAARDAVRQAAARCGNHPATFAISVVNEIPPDLVRYHGRRAVEAFIDELVGIAKAEAPDCLVTFASFPTTEYLQPRGIDFVCFNVYLHDPQVFGNYLARLQSLADDKPLIIGEYGIDTHHEYDESTQADILVEHVKAVFDEGCAGTIIFSYTDDWVVNGYRIDDWKFGIVRADTDEHGCRRPKPAFATLRAVLGRVPQICEDPLPMCSVVICSYNGAATIESCLRSMRRIDYRGGYEVIFVDDGSTDRTPEILRQFSEVRYIRLDPNMGLAHARNVGLEAANGEIVVYTDSDCEVDEDWLYHLAATLTRSTHVGVGGPNLIPDESSWVADCIGISPGGPTHVMLNDREAEHVPGCNMAFYAGIARQINGFDPQFRQAGDDVDFIWRLQHKGYTIGFAPAAQVWHYRRNTIGAYLRQQRGYGQAEALLKFKHPEKFNAFGAGHWRGRIYGREAAGVRIGRDVIYHGTFGTALFQTIYRQPASLAAGVLMSIEWHLLAGFVAMLGLAIMPLLWVALAMFATPVGLAIAAAAQAPRPRHGHWLARPLVAWLHFCQPVTRGWARYSVRLRAKVMNRRARGHRPAGCLPLDPHEPYTLRYWHDEQDRLPLLRRIVQQVQSAAWRMRVDSGWNDWDIEIYASRYTKVRLVTASEYHDGRGYLTRVRIRTAMSKFCQVILGGSVILAGLLLTVLGPVAWPGGLIPLTWGAVYWVDRWRVRRPVLGLVEASAGQAGYWPVHASDPPPQPGEAKPLGARPAQAIR